MDIGLTVVIVLVVLAVVAAAALLAVRARRRRQEEQRLEAAEHRHEAEVRAASAERREAESAERAARAEHEQAQAREQAARASQDREVAEARQAAADRIDPDVDHDADAAAGDRQTGATDPAARTDDLRLDTDGGDARGERSGESAEGRRHDARDGQHRVVGAPGTHAEQEPGDPHERRPDVGQHRDADGPAAGIPQHDDRRMTAAAGEHQAHESGTDPAARTDDHRTGDHPVADHPVGDDRRSGHGPGLGHGSDQRGVDRHGSDQDGSDQHEPGRDQARASDAGERADSAARTDELPPSQGWHGPTASGGFAAVPPHSTGSAAAPSAEPAPSAPRHRVADGAEGATAGADATERDAAAGGTAPQPAVPAQRGGEHDQRGSAAEGKHHGPVRALADRILRRNS